MDHLFKTIGLDSLIFIDLLHPTVTNYLLCWQGYIGSKSSIV